MTIKPTSYVPTGTPDEIKSAYEFTRQGFEAMCVKRDFPLVHPEYPKYLGQKMWELSKGVFTYSDETDSLVEQTFSSVEEATKAFDDYADWLCYGPDDITIGETK